MRSLHTLSGLKKLCPDLWSKTFKCRSISCVSSGYFQNSNNILSNLPSCVKKSKISSSLIKLAPHQSRRNLSSSNFTSYRSEMKDDEDLAGLDETQVKLMEEECILVDKNDQVIGSASKKVCHLLNNIDKGMLHRAFSVFLFNENGELLLQQRADTKITFPGHYTNSCCSHPLNMAGETDEMEAMGVKRAAQRKLAHELGIKPQQVPLDDFTYLTRILYKAENVPRDGKWGESEIDYILFIQANVDIVVNENEVKSYRYVSIPELKDLIESADSNGMLITPWFRLIVKNFLFDWWKDLSDVSIHEDRDTIHRMT